MDNLKSRLSDLLTLYLTMLSLFEAIVLEQLVTRVAQVSGGAFFEGWTVGLLIQALIVLLSIFHMWVGFMTITAPIRRVIRGSDFLVPFILGGVQLIAIQLIGLKIEPSFLIIFVLGLSAGFIAVCMNLQAARTDKISELVAKLFPLRTYGVLTGMIAGTGIIGAASLSFSQTMGQIFAGMLLIMLALLVGGSLKWWSTFVSMNRIKDVHSNSPLKDRVTGLLPVYLTLVSLIEAVVLEQLITRAAVVSGGPFLDGWTLDLGLQMATVFASIVTMWVAFLTDLIPVRRVMRSSDLVNVIGIGLFQLIAVQLIDLEVQASFLMTVGLGSIGGVVTRFKNQKAAMSDAVARGLVRLYPHRQMLVLIGLMTPVGVIGALCVPIFSWAGQTTTFILFALFLTIDVMLMRWWNKVVKMHRLQ